MHGKIVSEIPVCYSNFQRAWADDSLPVFSFLDISDSGRCKWYESPCCLEHGIVVLMISMKCTPSVPPVGDYWEVFRISDVWQYVWSKVTARHFSWGEDLCMGTTVCVFHAQFRHWRNKCTYRLTLVRQSYLADLCLFQVADAFNVDGAEVDALIKCVFKEIPPCPSVACS